MYKFILHILGEKSLNVILFSALKQPKRVKLTCNLTLGCLLICKIDLNQTRTIIKLYMYNYVLTVLHICMKFTNNCYKILIVFFLKFD